MFDDLQRPGCCGCPPFQLRAARCDVDLFFVVVACMFIQIGFVRAAVVAPAWDHFDIFPFRSASVPRCCENHVDLALD